MTNDWDLVATDSQCYPPLLSLLAKTHLNIQRASAHPEGRGDAIKQNQKNLAADVFHIHVTLSSI